MQIVVKLYIHHCYGIAHKKLIDWIDRDAVCRADLCDHKDHVAKLTCAASSWWRFATAEDRQRLAAVIRRGIRYGLCNPDHMSLEDLVTDADDKRLNLIFIW